MLIKIIIKKYDPYNALSFEENIKKENVLIMI